LSKSLHYGREELDCLLKDSHYREQHDLFFYNKFS
jgi:hypothetical protein